MSSQKRSKKGDPVILAARSFRVPEGENLQAIFKYYSALNCPRSLTCAMLLKYKEYDQLVNLDVDPSHYNSAWDFRDAYQATKFLSKNSFLPLSVDRKEVALKKFDQMEELCKQTNRRFRTPELDPFSNWSNVSLLNAMRQKISKVLGACDPETVFGSANWGPGVSTLLKGSRVSSTNKFQCETGITRDLFSLMFVPEVPYETGPFGQAYPLWNDHLMLIGGPTYEIGNVVITVPKNAKTDRVIAVEPGINLWFQKGIGTTIRQRLGMHGIDLAHQSVNQRLARVGSLTSELATVDFSSASDSISLELVRNVLPPDWFFWLNACRSQYGVSKSGPRLWEKFSSMGNGFTFELESLIFFAAAIAVCEHLKLPTDQISVYGDDVILPTQCFDLFASFSRYLGFEVNLSKSYSTGYFRESCGAYWYDGVDVQPIYLREVAQTPSQVYRFANAVRRMSRRHNNYLGCDARFFHVWNHLVNCLPSQLRLRIDERLGDGGFISNFDEATPSRLWTHPNFVQYEGYRVHHIVESGLSGLSEETGLLLARIKDISTRGSRNTDRPNIRTLLEAVSELVAPSVAHGNYYALRGKTKLRMVKSIVAQWTDLGPWY